MGKRLARHCSSKTGFKRKRENIKELKPIKKVVKEDPDTLHPTLENTSKAIFILDQAPLRKGVIGKKWKILESEEDMEFLSRHNINPNFCRPDVVYKALLDIFDSPICKAGMLGAVYLKIDSGAVFKIKPHVRLPRTCKRFCGLMSELLEKSCIRAKDSGEILICTVEEPITQHLPPNSRIIGLSNLSEKLVHIDNYINSAASDDMGLVFVVGTMIEGEIDKEYIDDFISVSNYALSANCCIGLICDALKHKWKIF